MNSEPETPETPRGPPEAAVPEHLPPPVPEQSIARRWLHGFVESQVRYLRWLVDRRATRRLVGLQAAWLRWLTDVFLNQVFAFEKVLFGRAFDYAMSALAVFSIALIFLNAFGVKWLFGLRVTSIDYAIFAVFAVEYMFRVLFAPSMWKYIRNHWYDPPGMLPLLLFEMLPHTGPLAMVRFLRLFRIFILLRSDITKRLVTQYTTLIAEKVTYTVMTRVLDIAQRRVNEELAGRSLEQEIKVALEKGRGEAAGAMRRLFRDIPLLDPLARRLTTSGLARTLSDRAIDLTVKALERIEVSHIITRQVNNVFETMHVELARDEMKRQQKERKQEEGGQGLAVPPRAGAEPEGKSSDGNKDKKPV